MRFLPGLMAAPNPLISGLNGGKVGVTRISLTMEGCTFTIEAANGRWELRRQGQKSGVPLLFETHQKAQAWAYAWIRRMSEGVRQ